LRGSGLDGLFYERWGSNWDWLFNRLGNSLNFLVNGPCDDLDGFRSRQRGNDSNNSLDRLRWGNLSAF